MSLNALRKFGLVSLKYPDVASLLGLAPLGYFLSLGLKASFLTYFKNKSSGPLLDPYKNSYVSSNGTKFIYGNSVGSMKKVTII